MYGLKNTLQKIIVYYRTVSNHNQEKQRLT